MKKVLSILAVLLSFVILCQSIPVSAVADALSSKEQEVSLPEISETELTEESSKTIPFILGEMTDMRTLDTKVFRMSDGSYSAAVYPTQVHYEENGQLIEIDYRFEEVTVDGENFFETKAGPAALRVPETIGEDSEVVFTSGEHSISFSLSAIEEIDAETQNPETDTKRLELLRETVFAELYTDEKFEELYSKSKEDAEVLDLGITEAVEELSDMVMSAPGAASFVKYGSVMNGIDLNYRLSGTTLKEEIVLNRQASALKTFSFTLHSGDLTPVLNKDNSVSLNSEDGEEQLCIAAPFMYDRVGAESSDIEVSLSDNGDGTYSYKLSPDKKWLGSAKRLYPVTIDPPVTDSSYDTVKDTTGVFASSVGTLANVGELNYLKIGKRYDSATQTTPEVQAMLYSQLPDVINSTTNIVHAYLYLYSYESGFSSCPSDMQINAYMMTSDWNTSSFTENAPIALGSNGRADYSDVLDYIYFNDSERTSKIYQLEFTEAAQKWLDGTSPNYGIALRADGLGTAESFARFFDSTNLGEVDTEGNTLSPRFVYVYRDSRGIEDYWSFTSMEAGRTGVGAVNNDNGNFVTVQDLVSSTGNNMPASLSLIYSANSTDNDSAGMGMWRTNYHMKIESCNLVFDIPGAEEITYKYCLRDSDGTKHYFKEEGDEHKDEDGLGLTLTETDGATLGYYYKIETKDKTEYQFDFYGRLSKIVDSNGNYNRVVYESGSGSDASKNRIIRIEEGSRMSTSIRTTSLTLDSATGDITVTNQDGGYAKLDFLSATNRTLQYIIYEDNINTSFTYTQIGQGYFPTGITDGRGHKTTVTYINGESKRASSIQWGTDTTPLQRYTFTYGHNSTKIADIEGRVTTLQFNGFGQTVGVVDHASSIGQSYEFGAPGGTGVDEGTENKLLLTSKAIYATENRMNYGGQNSAAATDAYSVSPSSEGLTKTFETASGNTGTGRMKLKKAEDCTDSRFVYQRITDIAEGKYTLSAYVSTNGVTLPGDGVKLWANVYNASGYRNTFASGDVRVTTAGEWVRLQTTITTLSGDTRIDAGIIFPEGTTGTVYVDDVQLEHNISGGAGSFNQLNNPSMQNSLLSWGGSGGFTVESADSAAPAGLKYAAKVTGDPAGWKTLTQQVYVDGEKGDVFIAGAFAKANSVPLPDEKGNKKGLPEFGLHISFHNGNTKVGETFVSSFNSGCEDWQFLTDKVIAPDDYTFVTYTFIYGYNTGTARVSAPFLYKESYGQSYVYDSEGNVVSSTDAAETEATFAYQDDTLTESLSPTGSRYMYANDDTTKNTRYALSNSGQRIGFSYNLSGDATVMQINDLQFIPSLEYTSGETVDCYIVNAKNGRVLEPHALSAGNKVYAKNLDYAAGEMWQLRYLSGYTYSVRFKDDTTLGLSKTSADAFCYIDKVTVNSSYVPTVAFKFSIESNGDGSFKISTASSNHTEYLYQTDGLHYAGSNSYSVRAAEYDEKDPAFKWYLVSTASGTEKMKTSATYSADGRQVIESTDVMGNETQYEYGANGLAEKVTDPSGVETVYTYDSMNRTESVTSESAKVQYTYDKDLLKNILVDEGLLRYSFDYDAYGRKTAVYVGGATQQRTLATYTYTDRLLTRQTYGNGTNFIDFEYDGLDRLTKKTYNGDATKYVKYLYDPNGNQYGIQDGIWGRNTYFEYDLAGRVNGVGVYDQSGAMRAYQSVRYNDGKGTVESMTSTMFSAAGTRLREVDYTFTYGDPAKGEIPDTLYKYTVNSGEYTFAYDGLARLEGRTLKYGTNTKTESYTYKDSNLAGYTTTLVDTMTDFSGKAHSYTYDANGNITSETYDNYTVTYEYDHLNRLVRYNNPEIDSTYTYEYDDRGNMTAFGIYEYSAGELGYCYIIIDYGYNDQSWPDLMTSYDNVNITYDDLGNPLNWIWGESLTWENGRQLSRFQGNGKTVDYTYNADGLRTGKSGDVTTEYYIADGQYIGEVTTLNGTQYVIAYLYDENGAPAGLNVNGTEYFFVKNIQGDILEILDSNGNSIVSYRYDAYGANISETTSTHVVARLNPFRYRGYMYDTESGFYYLRSRYYDPFVGRFLNADSVIDQRSVAGSNLFSYCLNNPVNMSDETGNIPFFVITAAIGAVAGAVVGGIVAAKSGKNVWAGIGIGAAAGGLIGAGLGAATGALLGVGASASTSVVLGTASAKLAATGTTLGLGASKVIDKIANGYEKAKSVITGSTEVYRSIGNAEMLDIQKTGQFNLPANGLEAKQFTFAYSEAVKFGQNYGQNIIVKASVPNAYLSTLDFTKVDTFIFKSGTLTVWESQLTQFNQAVEGTIQILP